MKPASMSVTKKSPEHAARASTAKTPTEKTVAEADAPSKTKSPRAKKSLFEGIADAAQSILRPKRSKSTAPKTEVTSETKVRRTYTRRKKIEVPSILLEGDAPVPTPVSGPGQKYALGPTPPSQSFPTAESELPESYGTKKLFLTARDPHWIYAHWDLTQAQQLKLNALSSDGHLVLRIYPHKLEGHPLYEIHVHPESRHWFAHVERAGDSYVAELGYYSALGRWTRISISSGTMTPPDAVSADEAAEFATIPFEFPFARLMEIVKAAVRENLPLAQAIEELRHNGHPDLPRVTSKPPATWTPQQEHALAKVINIDETRRVWMGSLEITELIRRKLAHEISSLGVSSFGVSSLSSPFGGLERAKGFWFNVNAELIIYGATEPGAKVTLGGHEIKLRSDGSFSFRFALPDGKYDLPAVAVSADGADARAADLKFSRETEYLGDVGAHPQDPLLKTPLPQNL
ncbi:MAG TPA: DUF4912 domain-containing protein [Candidatus Aquilonibacter sp.]|nr:DUF4912 domain-containing protein [Candidatus Aquilonibacter sp.]